MTGSTGRRMHWEDFMTCNVRGDSQSRISRRTFANGLAVAAGATVLGANSALAQQSSEAAPPTTITNPPRDFGPDGAPTTYFWNPDIIAVDPSFNNLAQPNTAIKRLYTGLLWAEGPAWSAQGRYLLWSDIPNNRQMRWSEDDGRVSVSAHHLTTQPATRSTSRAGSSPANISREGLCATSTTARCRCSPTASTAKSSTRPTISSPSR